MTTPCFNFPLVSFSQILYGNVMVDLSKDDFQLEVLDETTPVLVDFWAPWCGPCQAVTPVLNELTKEYGNKVKIVKVNVDEGATLAQKYNVVSIPTLVVFKDGKEIERQIGFNGKEALVKIIDKAL